jgi:hypothetical protein
MATCLKRSVLQAPDRPGLARRAALDFDAATQAATPRVLPHAGSTGRPTGMQAFGRPLTRSSLGGNPLARALTNIGHALAPQRTAPVPTNTRGPAAGTTGAQGVGTLTNGRLIILAWGAAYTEPMEILRPAGLRIAAIEAARIVSPHEPDRYFRNGVACDWVDDGAPTRITIRSIDGMVIGDPTVLQYTFVYFGA